MAGIRPTFVTGAAAKIKLNGKTLAFCQDFQCSIQILTQTPKVLGKYEGDSVEPLGYLVQGSFSIIRYTKGIKQAIGGNAFPRGLAANDAGNGAGNWGTMWGGSAGDFLARNGIGNNGRAHEALDPSKFASGTTFDIQIYQKVDKRDGGSVDNGGGLSGVISDITSVLQGGNDSGPGNNPTMNYLGILNIRNARITQADFSLSKRGPAVDHFTFVALYVDGDAYVANSSGPT
jgi:hypothetical protein